MTQTPALSLTRTAYIICLTKKGATKTAAQKRRTFQTKGIKATAVALLLNGRWVVAITH